MAWTGRGSTRAWRELRARILRRDPLCQLGLSMCIGRSTQVDHIAPKAEGGTDQPANLRGVCKPCHDSKSATEASRGRARARKSKTTRGAEDHPGLISPDA